MPLSSVKANTFDDAVDDWSSDVREELEANQLNGHVGQKLVSETELVRFWMMHLEPDERMPFHRHVLNYLWTACCPALRDRDTATEASAFTNTFAARRCTSIFPAVREWCMTSRTSVTPQSRL